MNTKEFTELLYTELERDDLKGKIISIEHLPELQEGIEGPYANGEIDEEFYQKELSDFDFNIMRDFPDARSLMIVAMPQPQIQVEFTLHERSLNAMIPPTYSYAPDTHIFNLLEKLLTPNGYRVVKTSGLPLKTLAVRSGLALYGKNNIAYIPEKGSFERLVAFYSDFPCIEDSWGNPQKMEFCQTCSACANACPTGAIVSDRFLLHAERCLTFLNEFPGEFPDWLNPSCHHCLVGCLMCQRCCPANKHVANWVEETARFSPEETRLLLQGVSKDELPAETAQKLEQLGMLGYLSVLPRNLRVLFEKRNIPSNNIP